MFLYCVNVLKYKFMKISHFVGISFFDCVYVSVTWNLGDARFYFVGKFIPFRWF